MVWINKAGNISFPCYDAHGNMVATISRAGGSYSLGNQRSYDAWGWVREQSGPGDPKGRYCAQLGHKQDDESSLVYMRARYYEPGTGRFVSQDPGRNGGNWFSYCSNNPVDCVDSSGRDWKGAAGAGAGSACAAWGLIFTTAALCAVAAATNPQELATAYGCMAIAETCNALAMSFATLTVDEAINSGLMLVAIVIWHEDFQLMSAQAAVAASVDAKTFAAPAALACLAENMAVVSILISIDIDAAQTP